MAVNDTLNFTRVLPPLSYAAGDGAELLLGGVLIEGGSFKYLGKTYNVSREGPDLYEGIDYGDGFHRLQKITRTVRRAWDQNG